MVTTVGLGTAAPVVTTVGLGTAAPVVTTTSTVEALRRPPKVFARLASAQAEVQAITRVDAGSVGVGTFSSAGATFVVDALCSFRRDHPDGSRP